MDFKTYRDGSAAVAPTAASLSPLFDDMFKCFICFETLVKPVMCPKCSKVGCEGCVKKWLTEEQSQCPHCRATLFDTQLVPCRFIDDMVVQLQKVLLDSKNTKKTTDELCSRHSVQLYYYCHDCSEGICPDCAVLDPTHREHKFEHLHTVYSQHRSAITAKSLALYEAMDEHRRLLTKIDKKLFVFRDQKRKIEAQHQLMLQNAEKKFVMDSHQPIQSLRALRDRLIKEKQEIRQALNDVHQSLTTTSQTALIKNSENIMQLIKEKQVDISQLTLPIITSQVDSDLLPPYEVHDFGFRKAREVIRTADMESTPILASGLHWKLHMGHTDSHMSVYLQLLTDKPEAETYNFRFELINYNSPFENLVREGEATFAAGHAAGFRYFISLEKLMADGFPDPNTGDVIVRLYVRAASYGQKCRDLERRIASITGNRRGSETVPEHPVTNLRFCDHDLGSETEISPPVGYQPSQSNRSSPHNRSRTVSQVSASSVTDLTWSFRQPGASDEVASLPHDFSSDEDFQSPLSERSATLEELISRSASPPSPPPQNRSDRDDVPTVGRGLLTATGQSRWPVRASLRQQRNPQTRQSTFSFSSSTYENDEPHGAATAAEPGQLVDHNIAEAVARLQSLSMADSQAGLTDQYLRYERRTVDDDESTVSSESQSSSHRVVPPRYPCSTYPILPGLEDALPTDNENGRPTADVSNDSGRANLGVPDAAAILERLSELDNERLTRIMRNNGARVSADSPDRDGRPDRPFTSLRNEMAEFETFVDSVTQEVRDFENLVVATATERDATRMRNIRALGATTQSRTLRRATQAEADSSANEFEEEVTPPEYRSLCESCHENRDSSFSSESGHSCSSRLGDPDDTNLPRSGSTRSLSDFGPHGDDQMDGYASEPSRAYGSHRHALSELQSNQSRASRAEPSPPMTVVSTTPRSRASYPFHARPNMRASMTFPSHQISTPLNRIRPPPPPPSTPFQFGASHTGTPPPFQFGATSHTSTPPPFQFGTTSHTGMFLPAALTTITPSGPHAVRQTAHPLQYLWETRAPPKRPIAAKPEDTLPTDDETPERGNRNPYRPSYRSKTEEEWDEQLEKEMEEDHRDSLRHQTNSSSSPRPLLPASTSPSMSTPPSRIRASSGPPTRSPPPPPTRANTHPKTLPLIPPVETSVESNPHPPAAPHRQRRPLSSSTTSTNTSSYRSAASEPESELRLDEAEEGVKRTVFDIAQGYSDYAARRIQEGLAKENATDPDLDIPFGVSGRKPGTRPGTPYTEVGEEESSSSGEISFTEGRTGRGLRQWR
ncbi:hypothetical protein DFS34DRAFT_623583 [Phlyctochytrium arcticum]|nr:hypothetical protein DFS34DRAFT_623583 [Phlyctochytrium arcticum]